MLSGVQHLNSLKENSVLCDHSLHILLTEIFKTFYFIKSMSIWHVLLMSNWVNNGNFATDTSDLEDGNGNDSNVPLTAITLIVTRP